MRNATKLRICDLVVALHSASAQAYASNRPISRFVYMRKHASQAFVYLGSDPKYTSKSSGYNSAPQYDTIARLGATEET